jgi:DNA polymerase III alpha subunit
MPDIDIDFADRDQALKLFDHVTASRIDQGQLIKHNTGVYLHDVSVDAVTNLCEIPYDQAESLGYFKIDFLNVSVYKDIKNEEHLIKLMNQEPVWDLLLDDDFTSMLFHVNGHGNILRKTKPDSVEKLAMVLAMIRPSKKYLLEKDWDTISKEIWRKPDNGEYYFKKSHAIAYAMVVVVQMNLICESISYDHS